MHISPEQLLSTDVTMKCGRWRAVIRYRDESGTPRTTTRSLDAGGVMAARREKDIWVASVLSGVEEVADRRPGRGDAGRGRGEPDVPAYVASMVSRLARTGAIEGSTALSYAQSLKTLASAFAGVGLRSLTPAMAQAWEAGLTSSGLSSSTVGKAHRLLKQAMSLAVAEGRIGRNPLDAVRPPKRRNKKPGINALDAAGRAAFLDAISSMRQTRVTVAATVAIYTGLRIGEICGLRWGDVDLGAGVLWVRRAIGVGDGHAYVKRPKTDRPRDVAMPPALSACLRGWRGAEGDSGDLAYVLGGDRFVTPTTISRGWATLSAALGLVGTEGRRVTFHDLRHTWATMAVAAGIDIKTVASNLGHSNAAMTLNIYASADPNAKRRAADIIQRAMRGEPPTGRI